MSKRLDVPRRLDVHAPFVVECQPAADHQLAAVAVDQARADRGADLGPQREPEALVGFEAAGGGDEHLLPRVSAIRGVYRSTVVAPLVFVIRPGQRQRRGESSLRRRLPEDGV